MIKFLKDKIYDYLIRREYRKLASTNTLTSIGINLSHLNVIDI